MTMSMDSRVQGVGSAVVRWCWLPGFLLLLLLHQAAASSDMTLQVARIRDGVRELIQDDINPVVFFESTSAEFRCFCLNTSLQITGGRVELLRNGFSLVDGSCAVIQMNYVTNMTMDDRGEYECRGYHPEDDSIELLTEIRDLEVLNPDDVIVAPSIQYAVSGSRHSLQCSVEDTSALVSWIPPGGNLSTQQSGPYTIETADLHHEGEYMCVIYFSNDDFYFHKTVQLYVVIPPVLTHPLPPQPQVMTTNTPLQFVIQFTSRFKTNTDVTWYHNNNRIQNGIETMFDSENGGHSTVTLDPVSRSNAGTYRVEVSNNFSSIPEPQRIASSSVDLRVSILPSMPTEVQAGNIAQHKVQLRWEVSSTHSDQRPDTISVLLTNLTDSTDTQYELSGSSTNVIIEVVPGMRYRAVIIARNTDGPTSTLPVEFRAAIAAPKVNPLIPVNGRRLNMTSFNITMTLLYTGADYITHFTVRIRHDNTTEWEDISPLTVETHSGSTEQGLKLYGIVTSDSLRGPSELQVEIVNDAGHRSHPHTIHEVLAPLSAPSTPTLLSSSHDSLTLSFLLPGQGTPPVLHIIINFTSPSHFQWECNGVEERALGEEQECTVPRLDSDTQYTLAVFGVGHAGRGNASKEVTFSTTSMDNSLPTWVVAVVSVVVAMAVLVVVLGVLLVIVHCFKLHQKKRLYIFKNKNIPSQMAPKQLDPSHAMLNRRQQKPTISGLSSVGPPISPTSTLTPQPCHSTPSTTVTFKFESTSGSSSCSNLDSEMSETQTPTYSYRVSPQPPPCPPAMHSQQSYHSLQRGTGRLQHTQESLHSTRDSLASCPPAPTHCVTNV